MRSQNHFPSIELNTRHSQFPSECRHVNRQLANETAPEYKCTSRRPISHYRHSDLFVTHFFCQMVNRRDLGNFFLSRVSSQPPAIIFTLPISLSDRLTQIFVFVTFRLAGGLPPTARSRAGECRSTTTLPATRTVSGRQGLR